MGLTVTHTRLSGRQRKSPELIPVFVLPRVLLQPVQSLRPLLPAMAAFCCLCLQPLPGSAADSHAEFLKGLRERGYFDTAIEYLDSLDSAADTPDDVRATVDLEKAFIWMDRRATARRRDDQLQFADQARQSFEGFLSRHPRHERAAEAHSQLGRLLFDQGRQLIWSGTSAANPTDRRKQTEEASELLLAARQSFGQARDQFKTRLDSQPFVDREDDEEAWKNRRRTEARYLNAWLSLINCTYEEAMMAPADSRRRSGLLTSALEQFDQIQTYSRTSAAGLHARLMMGRCRQELGDISEALGYFDELRSQPSQDPYMQRLSRTAQYYRLMCLNHESRAEYSNVVTEATRWLRAHDSEAATEAGLGILYEKAVAEEALARDEELDDEQRELRLRQTLADLEQVSAVVSPVQQQARQAAGRIRDELGEARRDPVKFETAFDRGRELTGRLQKARAAVQQAASDEERQQAEQELELLTSEAGRMFQLALRLRKPDSNVSAVAQARYLLSYVFLQQQKNHDAFVLARHVMRYHSNDAAETAADATEMAITAALRIRSAASEDDRSFGTSLVREICEEVIDGFPGSRAATQARMRLGRIYRELGEPRRAADAFLQVPEDDPRYAEARMEAGQAWWLAWAEATSEAADRPSAAVAVETREEWKQQARTLLSEGIELQRAALKDGRLTDEVIRAEVSLCGLLNQEGEFEQTIERLTEVTPTVMDAIDAEGERPQQGVRSAAFAGLCYRTLLRACVGARRIDDALDVMRRLQSLGAGSTTAVYTQLGRELQRELEQLQSSGDMERLQQVRASFEDFLDQIYQSRDPSNTGALLWIGETCAGLARSTDDPREAAGFLEKAATVFQELLNSELEESAATAVNLRLIRVYRDLHRYQEAVDLGTKFLTARPASVSVQLEVAHVLADWGENGEPTRLLESISGIPADEKDRPVWGWAALARRLQRSQGQPSWPDLKPLFLESRFELSNSRLRYARVSPDQGRKQLEAAARELTSMVQVSADLDDEWWTRFDGLYQDIQQQLGRPGMTLARPDIAGDDASGDNSEQPDRDRSTATVSAATVAAPDAPDHAGTRPSRATWLIGGIGLIAVLVAGVSLIVMRRPRRRVRHSFASAPEELVLPTGTAAPAAGPRPATTEPTEKGRQTSQRPRTGSRKKSARSSSSGRRSDGNPAAPRRKAPRKRPRPPSEQSEQ